MNFLSRVSIAGFNKQDNTNEAISVLLLCLLKSTYNLTYMETF